MDDLGAYGFQLRGLDDAARWMQPQPGRPALRVEVSSSTGGREASRVDAESADIALIGGGRLRASRHEPVLHYELPSLPSVADLLHPYLAPGAALFAKWSRLEALHAGAFLAPRGAVLLIGDKEAGKSTTLAWLAREQRVGVVADDMIVIQNGHALVGPRLIDMRIDEGSARDDVVRDGTRRRLQLESTSPSAPLAGTVVLEWGDDVSCIEVPPPERIGLLADSRMFPFLNGDPPELLDLVAKPMVRLRRPQAHGALPAVTELLVTLFV